MRYLKLPSLPSKKDTPWIEYDVMILHTVFELFVDFCENDYTISKLEEWTSYIPNLEEETEMDIASCSKQQEWAKEVLEIYKWVKLRQQYLYPVDGVKPGDNLAIWYLADEDTQVAKENEMLIKIINMRSSLWI